MSARLWRRLFLRVVVWGMLAGGFLLLLVVANATWNVFQKEREALYAYRIQSEALRDLEERKASLETKLKALDTERGVEEALRERYSVVKPGEEVIVLVEPKKSSADATTQAPQSIWQQFLGLFSWE